MKYHKIINGDAEFDGLDFLSLRQEDLFNAIEKENNPSARSSYSCLLGALTNKNKTPISSAFNGVVEKLRTNMELKNQDYVDRKTKEPHDEQQLANWVSVEALKKYQRKVVRAAVGVKTKCEDKELTWNDFKTIQKAVIVTLYINYRKQNEKYPSWFKALASSTELPDISTASHIAPKRLEFGDLHIVWHYYCSQGVPVENDVNTLYVAGDLPRHKRLWLTKQKNSTKPHWEYVNVMMNKAINLQLWAVEKYLPQQETRLDRLLILKSGDRMNRSNLSDWVQQSFAGLGVDLTANSLRHIVAQETGVTSQEKKLLGEQLKGMNHSNDVHNLVYSN